MFSVSNLQLYQVRRANVSEGTDEPEISGTRYNRKPVLDPVKNKGRVQLCLVIRASVSLETWSGVTRGSLGHPGLDILPADGSKRESGGSVWKLLRTRPRESINYICPQPIG